MKRAIASMVGVALAAAMMSAGAAAATRVTDSIVSSTVTCAGTWTDPSTGQVHEVYGVTVTFTHAGPRELRVYEKAGGTYIDSDHAWFYGSGTDTFNGSLAGGLVGQTVSFDIFVLKANNRTNSLVATASASTGTSSC